MSKYKTITVRAPEDLWQRVKVKLAKEGGTFQRKLTEALEAYDSAPEVKTRMAHVIREETRRNK
jgi:predicted DNA binding CopG/RHH family protein